MILININEQIQNLLTRSPGMLRLDPTIIQEDLLKLQQKRSRLRLKQEMMWRQIDYLYFETYNADQ